ncbi:MAG TPA: NAD(P)-dependent oxidoreductase [Acidimicrobiales bacterium]|nr:NAD(P)-dependent oxidoreductase [Acidimicrobiales bacterium]
MGPVPRAVGFVGLGRMGMPMSRRLAQAGYWVKGYDVSAEARSRASENGVKEASSLGEAADGADIVILMLPTSAEVAAVVDEELLHDHLPPGALIVDMSSSEPLRTRDLAERMGNAGWYFIDAPVSGGVSGAEAGTLTVMIGGGVGEVERARPFLEHLGRVVHAGPVGAGHAIKALNNLLSATHLWATTEAMIVGQRFGLDPQVMLDIFNSSSGRSGSTANKWPNFILPGTYNSGFGLRLMVKDMGTAVRLSEQMGVSSELGQAALRLWEQAAERLPAEADHTEVARWLRTDDHGT